MLGSLRSSSSMAPVPARSLHSKVIPSRGEPTSRAVSNQVVCCILALTFYWTPKTTHVFFSRRIAEYRSSVVFATRLLVHYAPALTLSHQRPYNGLYQLKWTNGERYASSMMVTLSVRHQWTSVVKTAVTQHSYGYVCIQLVYHKDNLTNTSPLYSTRYLSIETRGIVTGQSSSKLYSSSLVGTRLRP